jgi:hypothetical protein
MSQGIPQNRPGDREIMEFGDPEVLMLSGHGPAQVMWGVARTAAL